jgi:uncharacterized integral membrane protein
MDAMEPKAPPPPDEATHEGKGKGNHEGRPKEKPKEKPEGKPEGEHAVKRETPAAPVRRTAAGMLATHWKLALTVLAAALLLVLVVQNAQVIDVRLFFWRLQVSQAMLLFFALLIGGLLGVAFRSRRRADVRRAASSDRER